MYVFRRGEGRLVYLQRLVAVLVARHGLLEHHARVGLVPYHPGAGWSHRYCLCFFVFELSYTYLTYIHVLYILTTHRLFDLVRTEFGWSEPCLCAAIVLQGAG